MLRADRAVAAGGQVRRRGDERPEQTERVDDRRACGGPHAGPDAAAAQPGRLGRPRGDGGGAPVRRGRAGSGRPQGRPAPRAGGRRDRRNGPGQGGRPHGYLRHHGYCPRCLTPALLVALLTVVDMVICCFVQYVGEVEEACRCIGSWCPAPGWSRGPSWVTTACRSLRWSLGWRI